jgi:hypothetical protein
LLRHGIRVLVSEELAGEIGHWAGSRRAARDGLRRPPKRQLSWLAYIEEVDRQHVLVVTNVDRFARDAFDHAIIRRHLAGLGVVTLRAVTQPIDETPAGKFMEGIFAASPSSTTT